MIKKLLLAITLILPLALMAGNPNASTILSKTTSNLNSAKGYTADFSATTGDGETLTGKLTLAKEKFSMVGQGFGVWFNGSDMWSYTEGTGEVSLTSPTSEELMETNPFDIINNYAEYYNAKTISSGNGKYVIQLTAKGKNSPVKSAAVEINAATYLPSSIVATFPNSSTIQISISNTKASETAPAASAFVFPQTKYPGVEVVDLR